MSAFRPRLLDCLPGYGRAQFGKDLSAGITVGVLALPLAMAFAIASGMSPTAGIWTAIVAGFLISAFGGSRVQIGGPTGAFIPIVYGIVAVHGVQNLLVATMLAGLMLLAMGFARLGQLIRFIPVSVVTGFTNGIAVVIFLSQIKDFFGLQVNEVPAEFFAKMRVLAAHAHTADLPTLFFASASLAFLLFWNKVLNQRKEPLSAVPGPLALLVFATLLQALFNFPVETIGSRFGGIPQGWPEIGLPAFSLETLRHLIAPALTIALLGAIESLLSARVSDGSIDDRHDPNQELIAQGLGNLVAPLFGGFAATGAIARTATNVRTGGRTPVAGMTHALVLLAVVLVAAPAARFIPLPALSAILMLVAINMGEWHAFRTLRRFSLNYRAVLLATFLFTVIFDLTLAVEIGLVLASLFFIYRVSDLTRVERLPLDELQFLPAFQKADGTMRVAAYKMFGSLFFGTVHKIEALGEPEQRHPEILILDMQHVINMDTTGLEAMEGLQKTLARQGSQLLLCSLNAQPGSLIDRSGFRQVIGEDNVCGDLYSALARAKALLPRPDVAEV